MHNVLQLPKPSVDNWDWQLDSACRELPSEMFFHPSGERGRQRRNRENIAKTVCATCQVIEACRSHALAVPEKYGIWGGLGEEEREHLTKKPLTLVV
jgi:WhiB family redox-sensing transcriptional regulator